MGFERLVNLPLIVATEERTARTAALPFVEAYDRPTVQGEGPAAGRNATFLRFGGCSLSCSWCDSSFTWDSSRFNLREQITMLTADEIASRMIDADICVVTGGEPLLNQHNPAWPYLLGLLADRYRELHLETNGIHAPTALTAGAFTSISVSPKQAHAGTHRGNQDPTVTYPWHIVPAAFCKIVVKDAAGVEAAVDYALDAGWPRHRIWVMPEGITIDALNSRWPEVAQAAAELGINATHRLHVLAWGDKRGH